MENYFINGVCDVTFKSENLMFTSKLVQSLKLNDNLLKIKLVGFNLNEGLLRISKKYELQVNFNLISNNDNLKIGEFIFEKCKYLGLTNCEFDIEKIGQCELSFEVEPGNIVFQ